jgi:hypothetical protein
MSFAPEVAERALIACGRHCCLCHKFCGTKIELHHITPKSAGGTNDFENCIPLCFDCHAEVEHYNVKHPRGRKFSPRELKGHRDQWYARHALGRAEPMAPEHKQLDREVYRRLKEVLPSDGSIHFIRFNNYAGFSFDLDNHKDLDRFIRTCEFPEFEFVDPDLEGLRANLREQVQEFINVIAVNTWPVDRPNTHRNTVPPEWEYQEHERFENVVSRLHSLTTDICESYDSIVRLARHRLGVA